MNGIILAAMLALNPGYNNVGAAGEVVALNAATSNATATVTVSAVDSFTTYTNLTQEVIKYETAWKVTVTNYNPYTGYLLPTECFPVTYTVVSNGEEVTIRNYDGITWQESQGMDLVYDGVASANFYPTNFEGGLAGKFAGLLNGVANLKFGGVSPIDDTWPSITYGTEAVITTNIVVGKIDYSQFTDTNGVSTIVGTPVKFDMPITNTVVVAKVPSATYTATNGLATISTAGHFGSTTTNGYFFGGGIVVEGAVEGDRINIIIK